VEKILNKRKIQGKNKFLVCWKGYTVEADMWEDRGNLKNAEKLVEEFEREYGEEDRSQVTRAGRRREGVRQRATRKVHGKTHPQMGKQEV